MNKVSSSSPLLNLVWKSWGNTSTGASARTACKCSYCRSAFLGDSRCPVCTLYVPKSPQHLCILCTTLTSNTLLAIHVLYIVKQALRQRSNTQQPLLKATIPFDWAGRLSVQSKHTI